MGLRSNPGPLGDPEAPGVVFSPRDDPSDIRVWSDLGRLDCFGAPGEAPATRHYALPSSGATEPPTLKSCPIGNTGTPPTNPKGSQGVSWYQPVRKMSLGLIRQMEVVVDAPVIDVGGSESFLVDNLLTRGFSDLTVLDLSQVALHEARRRVGITVVRWVQADVVTWKPDRTYGLSHDRAVFHFLVDPDARAAYVRTLMAATAPGSAVILATFAPTGPETCSGLPVARYSSPALAEALGPRFQLLATEEEEHSTPSGGIQPFTWVAGRLS